MKESEFQKNFISKIKIIFPKARVTKNDAGYLQGIPDWSVLYKGKYALLEMKKSKTAHKQPNQQYYIDAANQDGGLGRFVYPENEDEVLDDLRNYFSN